MRLIDADTLVKNIETSKGNNPHDGIIEKGMHLHEHNHFLCLVAQQPTIDAVPVVRCKDCEHWGTGSIYETDRIKCCNYTKTVVRFDGFCVSGSDKTK